MNKQDQIKEAERLIALLDKENDEGPQVKVPSWLKITKKLQYYFDWKHVKWERGIGWYPESERIFLGGEVI